MAIEYHVCFVPLCSLGCIKNMSSGPAFPLHTCHKNIYTNHSFEYQDLNVEPNIHLELRVESSVESRVESLVESRIELFLESRV